MKFSFKLKLKLNLNNLKKENKFFIHNSIRNFLNTKKVFYFVDTQFLKMSTTFMRADNFVNAFLRNLLRHIIIRKIYNIKNLSVNISAHGT